MDLARDEETRVRNLGRLALEKAAKAGASKAGSNGISRTFATVSRVNGDGTIDVSMGDYTDVNGVTSECILRGLRMTVACSGAQVGDRVIVDTYAHVSVVTGILANADNTHSVRLYSEGINGFCDYRVVSGAAVCVVCDWLSVTANKTKKLGTLPVGLRPKYSAVGLCYVRGVANTIGQININSNGIVSLWCNVSNDGFFWWWCNIPVAIAMLCSVSYPVS